jgi:ABC-type branched-subunit amino acid transport system substrate-binding protein
MEKAQSRVHDGRLHRRQRRRRGAVITCVVVAAITLSACGSGGTSSKAKNEPTTTVSPAAPKDTSLAEGVTPTTIKLGISLVKFDCIKQYTDTIRLGQQAVYEAFIKDINDTGGIAGRKIVPDFKEYCPLTNTQILTYCTAFAQDDHVFAVLGTFIDFSGDAQTCIAKDKHKVLVTFDLTQAIMDKSPPGLIVTPGTIPERGVKILLELAAKQKTLEGKKVAVLGDTNVTSVVNNTIVPGLKKQGIALGSTALLSINSGGDTTVAQSQLDSFIEKWKTQGVNAVFLSGNFASAKQFVQKLRDKMPNVMLLADTTNTLAQAQQVQEAGVKPNSYEGLITAGGLSPKESDASENWKYCADIYKKETGKTAEGAQQIIKSADGKNILDEHGTISDACQLLWFFHDIADKTGKYLNNANWVNTVNTYGEIANRGSGPYSSIHQGKYSAEDNWRLQEYDSTIPPSGNWKPITPLQNITG